jgi:hypothetical protein
MNAETTWIGLSLKERATMREPASIHNAQSGKAEYSDGEA